MTNGLRSDGAVALCDRFPVTDVDAHIIEPADLYWFEQDTVKRVIDQLADNPMFETDFPHATSLSPGPASESPSPRDVVERSLGGLPDAVVGNVLQHTATELYQLEPPLRPENGVRS